MSPLNTNEKAFIATWLIIIALFFVIIPLLMGCSAKSVEKDEKILLDSEKVISDIWSIETDIKG